MFGLGNRPPYEELKQPITGFGLTAQGKLRITFQQAGPLDLTCDPGRRSDYLQLLAVAKQTQTPVMAQFERKINVFTMEKLPAGELRALELV